jgi:hypothetical protein
MAKPFETLTIDLKPEAKLLLSCARTQLSEATVTQIKTLLASEINWDILLQSAKDHKVSALLYRSLESAAPASMPEHFRAALKKQMQIDVQGNLSITKELLRLQGLFNQSKIGVIPYKGPIIAQSIYHDLSARPFDDLDILVREQDVIRSIELLTSHGYEMIRPENLIKLQRSLQILWLEHLVKRSPWAYQLIFWNAESEVMVELHWRVLPKYVFPASPNQLWDELEPVSFGGTTMFTLSPENLLWFLCLHASKHNWTQIRWLCDVSELIRAYPNLDWEKVAAQAKTLMIERRLYLGLYLAHLLLDIQIPPAIEEKIDHFPQVKFLAREVMQNLFSSDIEISENEKFLFQLRTMDRNADRLRFLLRTIKSVENIFTRQSKWGKPFSLFSISARLLKPRQHLEQR